MMKWINKKLDNMLFKRTVKADFHLTEKDLEFMRKMGKAYPDFLNMLEKIITAQVITGMSVRSVEGLIRRDAWIDCLGYVKKIMKEEVKKEKHDRIRNQRMQGKS